MTNTKEETFVYKEVKLKCDACECDILHNEDYYVDVDDCNNIICEDCTRDYIEDILSNMTTDELADLLKFEKCCNRALWED